MWTSPVQLISNSKNSLTCAHGARRPLLTSKRYEGESNLCQLAQARCLLARLVWVLYSAAASREALRAALSFSAHR